MHMVRVRDEGVREMATTFRDAASDLNLRKTPEEAKQRLFAMMEASVCGAPYDGFCAFGRCYCRGGGAYSRGRLPRQLASMAPK